MAAKTVVSTPLDEDTLERLDELCGEIHRTRAEVLRGLLYALLLPEKYFIIDEWRKVAQPASDTRALILRTITSKGQATVRELKQATHNAKVSASDWDNALAALCTSGE